MSLAPVGWRVCSLADVGLPGTPKIEPRRHPTELFELYSVPAFEQGEPEIVPGAAMASARQVVQPGDVLLCKINPRINRVWVVGPRREYPQVASTEWVVVRSHENQPQFLMHQMREESFRDRLLEDVSGVGGSLMRARSGGIGRLPMRIAPFAEQNRIIARIEALFARTRRARADLERTAPLSSHYRRATLATAYAGELSLTAMQASPVPLSECVRDFTYGTAMKCSRDPEGIPVLRIPNVAAGRVSLDDMKFAALPQREYAKLALEEGDLLIVRSNGSPELVGRPALVEQAAAGMAFAGYLIRARPRRERIDPAYLLHMLLSPAIRETVELNARSSSGVHNINATELGALRIPLPSLDEQRAAVRRIERAISHALVWEAETARALALLDSFDAAVLTRAFRGELVPQDPADEPVRLPPAPIASHPRRRRAAPSAAP